QPSLALTSTPPSLFFPLIPPPPTSTLFPYTTLFRSYFTKVFLRTNGHFGLTQQIAGINFMFYAKCCDPCNCFAVHDGMVDRCCRSEEHTSELQSRENLVCRLLLEKKKTK